MGRDEQKEGDKEFMQTCIFKKVCDMCGLVNYKLLKTIIRIFPWEKTHKLVRSQYVMNIEQNKKIEKIYQQETLSLSLR